MDVEASVTLRMRRQAVIARDAGPAELWSVIQAQALRRPVGRPAVMAGQLDRLLDVTQRPDVNFQVIPQEVGVRPALQGAFFLLLFEDDWRQGAVLVYRLVYSTV